MLLDEQPAPGGQIYRGIERAADASVAACRARSPTTCTAPRWRHGFRASGAALPSGSLVWQVTPQREVWFSARWTLAPGARRCSHPGNRCDGTAGSAARLDAARRDDRWRAADHAEVVRRRAGRTIRCRWFGSFAVSAGAAIPRRRRTSGRGARHDITRERMARAAASARSGRRRAGRRDLAQGTDDGRRHCAAAAFRAIAMSATFASRAPMPSPASPSAAAQPSIASPRGLSRCMRA